MATQRYETVVKETDVFFSSNCPVILSAYAVLLDTKLKKYVAQLKLSNCGSEMISSVSVTVRTYDHFDELSEEVNGYQYVNINAEQGSEFGTKSLIPLSKNVKVKRLEVKVNKIVFSNGKTWDSGKGELLNNRLELKELTSVFSNKDIENYKFLLNDKMKFEPFQKDMLWVCSCGAINYGGENCYLCGADKAKVLDYVIKDHLYSALLDPKYNNGIEIKEQHSVEALTKAIAIFEELGDYKDSKELISKCKQEIVTIQKEIEAQKQEEERLANIRRAEAEQKSKKNTRIAIIIAIVAAACIAGFFVVTKVVIPNSNYNAAVALMESGDYEAAIEAFEAMGDYKDSADQIKRCEEAILDQKYNDAIALMNSGEYQAAISAFKELNDYKDSKDQIAKCEEFITEKEYKDAVKLLESGDYIGAYTALKKLRNYKDCEALIDSIKPKYELELIRKNDVGSTVYYGKYFFDDDKAEQDIEWIILAKENNKAFLVSKNVIDCLPFNTEKEAINWEDCSLRKWLNDDFYDAAFTEEEKDQIEVTTLIPNEEEKDKSEVETEDRVFILSNDEAKLFASDDERKCQASPYSISKKVYHNNTGCIWWLRSPGAGNYSFVVSHVDYDGKINIYGSEVQYTDYGVRPAIWLNIE